jgi:hypothetical protein
MWMPFSAIEVRFIEVKGRAAVGEIALTTNEYKTAERLKKDFGYMWFLIGLKKRQCLLESSSLFSVTY